MNAHLSKIVGEGLTYDDVLLIPAYSEILPREVSIKSKCPDSNAKKYKPKLIIKPPDMNKPMNMRKPFISR